MAQGKEYTKEQREVIIKSLQPYLEMGFSRNKACEFIGLTPQTLSVWVKDDESLLMKLTGWENVLNTIAINNIAQAIKKESELDDDIRKENSWKWAERRMKEDFSLRTEQAGPDGKELPQPILNAYVLNNDKSQENIKDVQEDTSSTRGDFSIENNLNPIVVDSSSTNGQGENFDFSGLGIHPTS